MSLQTIANAGESRHIVSPAFFFRQSSTTSENRNTLAALRHKRAYGARFAHTALGSVTPAVVSKRGLAGLLIVAILSYGGAGEYFRSKPRFSHTSFVQSTVRQNNDRTRTAPEHMLGRRSEEQMAELLSCTGSPHQNSVDGKLFGFANDL